MKKKRRGSGRERSIYTICQAPNPCDKKDESDITDESAGKPMVAYRELVVNARFNGQDDAFPVARPIEGEDHDMIDAEPSKHLSEADLLELQAGAYGTGAGIKPAAKSN